MQWIWGSTISSWLEEFFSTMLYLFLWNPLYGLTKQNKDGLKVQKSEQISEKILKYDQRMWAYLVLVI